MFLPERVEAAVGQLPRGERVREGQLHTRPRDKLARQIYHKKKTGVPPFVFRMFVPSQSC
jgi:hypothetical protein